MPPLLFADKSQFSQILFKIDINWLESFKKPLESYLGVLI